MFCLLLFYFNWEGFYFPETAINHNINEAHRFHGGNKKIVPIILEGVRLYKAVYNLHLYTLLGLSGVAVWPLGSCQSWKSYEYSFTTFLVL